MLDWFRRKRIGRKRPRRTREGRTPIYEFLQTWDGKAPLPDETPEPGKLRFAPGALEGVVRNHGQLGEADQRKLAEIHAALERARQSEDETHLDALYELLVDIEALRFADPVARPLAGSSRATMTRVARWLLTRATHREPVKLGLVLLGVSAPETDLPLARTFARHGEFTSWAADCTWNLLDDAVPVWMEMCEGQSGWGRVELVQRICSEGGERGDVVRWLLRHGCDGDFLDTYIAYDCAVIGRLAEALDGDELDPELRTGARRILAALIAGGPAEDLADLDDRAAVLDRYTQWMQTLEPSIGELALLASIVSWLEEHDLGDAELQQRLRIRGRGILERPRSIEAVIAAIRANEPSAWPIAETLRLDRWEEAFANLRQPSPHDAWWYQSLLTTTDAERLARLLAFAEERLPLASIATGPTDVPGIGARFEPHNVIDMLLQAMARPEVFSSKLIAAALRSAVPRNRYGAMRAVAAHRGQLDTAIRDALAKMARDDTRADLREQARQALR